MVLGVGAGVLVAVCACTPAALDPTGTPTTGGNGESTGQGGAPADDLVGALRALAPSQEIVVGTNGGEVIPAEHGPIRVFSDRDPEALT